MAMWYCAVNQQKYGPVDEAQVHGWIRQGRLAPDTLVWTEGMETWQPIHDIPRLAAMFDEVTGALRPDIAMEGHLGEVGRSNGLAIAGMILGIVGTLTFCLWCLSIPLGVVGMVLSIMGIRRHGQTGTGRGMAITGVVLSGLALLLGLLVIVLGDTHFNYRL